MDTPGGGLRPQSIDVIEECGVGRGEVMSLVVVDYRESAERGKKGVSLFAERLRIFSMILGMVCLGCEGVCCCVFVDSRELTNGDRDAGKRWVCRVYIGIYRGEKGGFRGLSYGQGRYI